jgi:hypothetical protein
MLRLEELELRITPDATPLGPQALLAEMSAVTGALQLQANLLNSLLPAPQPTLFGNLQGLILTSQLLAQDATITTGLFSNLAQVILTGSFVDALTTTLGPKG